MELRVMNEKIRLLDNDASQLRKVLTGEMQNLTTDVQQQKRHNQQITGRLEELCNLAEMFKEFLRVSGIEQVDISQLSVKLSTLSANVDNLKLMLRDICQDQTRQRQELESPHTANEKHMDSVCNKYIKRHMSESERLLSELALMRQKFHSANDKNKGLQMALEESRTTCDRLHKESELVVKNVNTWVQEKNAANEKLVNTIREQTNAMMQLKAEKEQMLDQITEVHKQNDMMKIELDNNCNKADRFWKHDLQVVFSNLGFTVRRRDDLADQEIMLYLDDISHNVDHSVFDCLVICILTHGIKNYVYGSNGKLVSIKDMTSVFQANRCPKLAGKPKLFFLQTCLGRNIMSGNEIETDAAPSPSGQIETDSAPSPSGHGSDVEIDGGKEMIPNEADFLVGYATVPGYVSFRCERNCSWYIPKLCELLEKYSPRHDLLSILVVVNSEVSRAYWTQLDGRVFKQMPAPLVTLRKKLYFRIKSDVEI